MNRLIFARVVLIVGTVVLLSALALGIFSSDDRSSGPAKVGYVSANGKKVEAPPAAVAQAAGPRAETGLGGDGNAATQHSSDMANPDAPVVSGPVPAAAPYQRGCLTRSNTVNFSYRNGTKPSLIVPHLTVAPNTAGWGDINGVAVFLNRAATQASANYIVDNENHCIYTVAEVFKAWAQANYNSATACSIEEQNTGNEQRYGAPDLHQLAVIVHDCSVRWHIPLQRAIVSNGRVLRAGVIDHYHLLAAGGGHFDVHNFGAHCLNQGPGSDTWKCVDYIIAQAKAIGGPPAKPITASQKARCRELNGLKRKAARPHTTLSKRERARGKAIKDGEHKHGLKCRFGPPGRLVRV